MDKKDIASLLHEVGVMLELKGENPFKVRAYYQAARAVESLTENIVEMYQQNTLKDVKGIGKGMLENISQLITTGELQYYADLKDEMPAGLFEMLKVPGLGPKKVRALYSKLGISSLGELEYACQENRLTTLEGFGSKTQENVLKGIDFLKKNQGQHLWAEALLWAEIVKEELAQIAGVEAISVAGSLRRGKEIVKDIDMVVSLADEISLENCIANIKRISSIKEITAQGNTKISAILTWGISLDIRIVTAEQFASALHHFTGSKEHNTEIRHLAKKKNLKINEYGIWQDEKPINPTSEEEFFAILGMEYIPPQLRENRGEIQASVAGKLPTLLNIQDIRGQLHIHSTYSDGLNTIEEIVLAAKERGYSYIGITDHSKSAVYANGLSEEALKRQWEEIDFLNEKYDEIEIFKGIEVDILSDGSLDYQNEILEKLDFVIASIHSNFRQSMETMTNRIINAISHPHVHILGHPTGRLLLGRSGYSVDMEKVLAAALEHNVTIELNASPYRLDLDWKYCQQAKELGVKVVINSDAHRIETLDNIFYGVQMAKKGWLTRDDVLNTRTVQQLKEQFKNKG